MPADPLLPPSGVVWYKSRSFTGLWQASALMVLMWFADAVRLDVWDWRTGLALPLLANAIVVFKEMWSPTVVGPLNVMNRNNQ